MSSINKEILSRNYALKNGLKYYFTGLPCKNNHIAKRNTKSRHCMECQDLWRQKTYKRKREKNIKNIIELKKKWKAAHNERLNEWNNEIKKIKDEEKKQFQKITKEDAKQKKLKKYFTGIPCKYGHINERLVKSGDCVDCANQRQRKYYEEGRYQSKREIYLKSDSYKKSRQKTLKKYNTSERGKIIRNINAAKFRQTTKYKERRKSYESEKRKSDVNFRLRKNLRGIIHQYIKRTKGVKANNTIKLTGCSLNQLRDHLQKKFKEGMNWENYGDWHIDHIKPASLFDLTKENEQKEAFHYSNLQPLWARENIIKSDKY